VQVFDKEGKTEGLVITQGLPRGIAFLGRFASDDASSAARLILSPDESFSIDLPAAPLLIAI
jgi:hypothetical protein